MGLKAFPYFQEALWQSSEEEHHLFDLILLSVPSFAPIPIKKRALRWRKDQAFTQPSSFYKMSIKPELSWSVSWPERYDDRQIKLARMHERQQAWMVEEADATFQEVFSQVRLTDLIKLLPWCISSTVPLHYISRSLATTAQQDEDIPATTTVSDPEGSLALGPSSSPACPTGTLPLPVPPLRNIPFVGTPPVRHHLLSSLPAPHRKSRTTLPAAHMAIIMTSGPMLTPQRLRLGVNTALHRVTRTCLNWYQRLGPALNKNKCRNLPAPFLSNQGHC